MCGRYTLHLGLESLSRQFSLEQAPELSPRYNIAPSQPVIAIRAQAGNGQREAFEARWGLVPPWARDLHIGYRMINARAETARSKPAFRSACRKRRCILPASGFYEWKHLPSRKQPYYIYPRQADPHRTNGPSLAFAGLWEQWRSPEGEWIESAAILTIAANDFMSALHDRMPVILQSSDFGLWLDPARVPDEDAYRAFCAPAPEGLLCMHPVSAAVNSPRPDQPGLIDPVEPGLPFVPREKPADPRQETLF